jgi:hypothetical protein
MLGEAHVLAGEVDKAGRRAGEAVALARRYGQRGWEAWALRLQGENALALEAPDVAEARFAEATALAAERGMRPLLAHCRLGVGHARALGGDRTRARSEITAALREYRAMTMPYWIARAEDALAKL